MTLFSTDRLRSGLRIIPALLGLVSLCVAVPASAQKSTNKPVAAQALRLYTLDCGLTEFQDGSVFADTGEYDGKYVALPTPCFLIHHGAGWLLWDTGNGDQLVGSATGKLVFGGKFTQKRSLAGQLAELGLKPDDIRYVALSHLHQDHTGNIKLFPNATFLVSTKELDWARGKPTPFGVDVEAIAPLAGARIEAVDQDKDIFGDGSVRILLAPGHTPGERMMLVKLAKSGSVLISGDAVHTHENYANDLVPSANVSRADTLASLGRLKRLAANEHARVIIQHDPKDFASMPAFPRYLD